MDLSYLRKELSINSKNSGETIAHGSGQNNQTKQQDHTHAHQD